MRFAVLNKHRHDFRAPRKTLALVASWLVVAPLLSLIAVTSSASQASAVDCVVGSTQDCPGASAKHIKDATGTNTDGVYWITVGGVSTQVYSIMNSAMDGGGWMLAMKGANTGSTFNYNSTYWTTANTLNTTYLRRNDSSYNEDAKFSVFNSTPASKVLAIFPDVTAGGAITGQSYGFTWNETMPTPANTQSYSGRPVQGDYTGKTLRELFAGGEKIYIRDATNASPYRAVGSGIFSTQTDVRFFGFNYVGGHNTRSRFGFGFNENSSGAAYPYANEGSNDIENGIGLSRSNTSAGDFIYCCQNSNGVNRQMKFELYVKAYATAPESPTNLTATPSDSQVTLNWGAASATSPVTNYTVQISSNGGASWSTAISLDASARSYTYTGLINGTTYNFRVNGVNLLGAGTFATVSAIPALPPDAPTINSLTARQGAVCAANANPSTGVTATMVGNDCVVRFTNVGTTTWTPPADVTSVQVLTVGGGGGGGFDMGGGGGGGAVVAGTFAVQSTSYSLTVGAGGNGSGANLNGNGNGHYYTVGSSNGQDSTISGTGLNLRAKGGGAGASSYYGYTPNYGAGLSGGNGGGSSGYSDGNTKAGGTQTQSTLGSTTGLSTIQSGSTGYNGGRGGGQYYSGGGGGAGAQGVDSTARPDGGSGFLSSITGTSYYWGGGGGGSGFSSAPGNGGAGGGGGGGGYGTGAGLGNTQGINAGANGQNRANAPGGDGGTNTGGGGGGGTHYVSDTKGGNGGSGIIVLRYEALPVYVEANLTAPAFNGGSAVTNYVYQYSADGSTWSSSINSSSSASTFNFTGIPTGSNTYFRVAAKNPAGTSPFVQYPTSLLVAAPPTAPLSLVTTRGNNQVALSWSAPSSTGAASLTDYQVEYSTDNSNWIVFADGTSTTTSTTVTGLNNGTPYFFRVSAINAAGAGSYVTSSAITPATTPAAPPSLAVSSVSLGTIGTNGLVGYWNFDNSSSLGVNSVSGNTTLSNGGSPTYTASGKNGGGLLLNGSSYLSGTVMNLPTGSSSYSIGGWIRNTTLGGQGILGWGNWGTTNQTNALRTASNAIYNYWWSNDVNVPMPSGQTLLNTWHHVLATYDGTTRKVYINGVLQSSAAASGLNAQNMNFRIGSTNNSEYFIGTLDDIVIYNRALSLAEVGNLMNSTAGSATLTWSDMTSTTLNGGETINNYTVDYSTDNVNWTNSAAGASTSTSATVTGLTSGANYYFRVRGVNAVGNGVYATTGPRAIANPATLTYNGNSNTSGTAPTDGTSYFVGGTAVVSSNTGALLRDGYAFAGWTDNSAGTGTVYVGGSNFTLASSSPVLYAKWNANSNTVTYATQGGSAVAAVTWLTGASLTLPAAPTRNGYTFAGWYDSSSGGVRVGSANASYTPSNTSGFTLYAQWTANTNTVTFNTQLGSSVSSVNWVTDSSLTLPAEPTRAGYTFTGWWTASSGGTKVGNAEAAYTPTNTASFTLYAQWSANTNVVTYDVLGGSAVNPGSFVTGGTLTLPAAPTLPGSTFVGWFLATTGGSALASTFSPTATSALTIYARWNTNRTLVIDSASFQPGYGRTATPPTLTATPTAGVGVGTTTFTSATTSICTVNASTGVVTFVTTGTCTLAATISESGGFTSATSPSISLAIRSTPGAPTSLVATPGAGQVTISWTAPAVTGGGISSYIVTATPGGATCTWTSGPLNCVVSGLTNGTSYSFTAVAVNSQGSSAASSAVSATPRTVPGAPTITSVTATAGFDIASLSNLYLRFKGSDYNATTKVWSDSSGNNRNISATNSKIGGSPVQVTTSSGNGNSKTFQVVAGDNSTWLKFGNPSSTGNYTVFTVARYAGTATNLNTNRGRIFTGNGGNWLSGFWWGNRGVAHHDGWLSPSDSLGTQNHWLISTSYPGNYRANGSLRTATGGGNNVYEICVNTCSYGNEQSTYEIADFIFFDRQLTITEIRQVEDYLADLYGVGNYTPNNAGANSPAASIAFTAPTSTGGSTITGYTITASNGATATGLTSPIAVTGLSLGVPYTFTVTATNAAGTSVASAPSTSITLRGSPGTSTAPSAAVTSSGISLVWAAPSGNGGTISDYTIQYSSNSGSTWTTFVDETSSTTAAVIRGLTLGTSYTFRVAAISEQGTGQFSPASAAVIPAGMPEAPGKPTGSASGNSITVSWAAAVNNGSAITNYTLSYSSDSGNTWTTVARSASTATSATVSNLTVAQTYIFRVFATNALGVSGNSESSNPIAIGTAPLAPTTLVAEVDATTSTSAVLSWKKPSGALGVVEAKPTIDSSSFTQGLLGKRYVGYYNDDVNFFTNNRLFSTNGTPVNSTSIMNFSSNTDLYSWMWTGFFKAPVSGVYRFYLSSDDASHLWIGDNATTGYTTSNATVNNGGLHPTITRTGSINLVADRFYPIRVMFGENYGGDVVSLFWDLPNGTRVTNGTGYFFQSPTGAVAAPVNGCAASVGNSAGVQISKDGNNCIVRFTNPGVNTWTAPTGISAVDVLVVGGGGGAGFDAAGGGGGGAVVERLAQSVTPGSSYSINVGAGGATSQSVGGQAQDGGSSTFGTISAVGGGGGGSKNANGRGVIGAGGGGGGHANPGNGGTTLGGTPSSGADSFWGWSASNNSMVNNQGSVVQFSYIQASLTRTIPITQNSAVSAVAFNVNVDNSITNIIGWNGERIDTYSIRVELLNSSGTVIAQNSYSGVQKHALTLRSVSVTNSDAALRNLSVRITITGFDAGYWAGFYGPIFRTPSLTVNGVAFPEPGAVTGFGGGGASGSRAVGNGGGGGGAGGVGGTSATSAGGVGVLSTITNSYFGGGGGGGSWNNTGGLGGNGGGGNGGNGSGAICGNDGAPNTGGGGGAMGNAGCSNRTLGAGGSGVVVLRYAAANTNIELPAPDDYVVQYADISAASAPDLITNGLVLQYEANSYSGSGTTLTDARGNSNATLVNNPAYTATGGGYFTMIGSSSHYIMSNTSLNSQFTSQANRTTTSIFMWVYPTSANGILISEFGAADINAGWHDSQIEMVNGTMRFRVWNGANLASAIATPVNNWYYVGFVYNQATQTLTGYVNGQVAVTSTNYARQAPYDYGSNLHFGIAARDTTNLGNGGFGSFRFGSLHVYNSALTTAQVQQNFAAGCARFALCDASIYQNYQSYSWQTFTDGISPLERATVTNLLPGKRYIFRVASKNGVGTGSFTAASNPLEIRGAPGTAPTLGTITAGNQRAVVNFTAPTNTGGSPIIRYTARAVATGTPALPARECTWSTGALSCTINELANGRTYNVTVTASNSFGESQPSSALTVTPKTIPDAPTALSITSGAAQLALSWSAPTFDGGSPITGYKIERATGDSATWTVVTANTGSTTTTSTVTGLTNGTVYRIRITAINLVGESVPSEIATGTPRGAASAPLAPTGNGNNASAFITWSAPANNGSPITDYEVQYGTSATGPWTTFTDAVSSVTGATVTELTNGTAYYFQVRAINGAGNGAWSPSSAAITPATIPGAPTLTAITIPNSNPSGRLAIAFTAGVTGGSAITGYEFSINGGATWTALTGTSNLVIEGLTNGVSYAISLRAVNAQGVGPASNEVTAAPTGPADAPVISGVVAENQKLTVSFSAPANNGGSAITGYRYQIRGLSGVWSAWTDVTAQPLVITSLTNGVSYSVKLQAVNAGGAGVESVSVSGTPFTNPSAPTITSVTPGNGSLAIAYTVDTNGSTITATEYSLDAGTTWIRTTSATSPLTITGLVNGTSYTPQVRVINSAGEGPSVTATATTPFREPFAPAITSVSSTSTSITMNFTVNNGGSAVTTIGYRSRFVAAPGVTSCAAAYGTLTWSENWSSWSEIPAANSLTLSGLSTGNCYDVQVRAQNSAGYGPTSRESGKPVTVPSAPSIVAITPAAGALTVTFNESADNGGAAISAYEYRIGSGSWTSLATLTGFTLGSSTVFTLDSLTNGSSYAITLRAVNSAGASAASTAVTATPVTTPSAPTITSVAPLDGALRIAFTAPTSTGGSTILGYQYQLTVGTTSGAWTNAVITSGTTTFDINGLSNATTYSVSLRAINAQGNSATNTFATAVAPGKAPDAPSISAIIVGNQRLSIVVAPGLDGGWPLTNYEYSINDGAWIRLNGAPDVALANPIIVTGLTNGTAYQFRVRSVNGIGESPASTSVTQTPATTPTAPTILSISTGDGSLSVAFTAPTANGGNNGGSAITSYQYSVNGGVNWLNRQTGATASPLTITGLTNGVAYNVMIRAVNAIGVGAASNAEVKFPQVPGAGRPISVTTTPLDGAVRVAWTPPAAYVGAPIVGYRVNAIPGTGSCLWSTGEYNCTISGLTNGTSYTFTVTSQRTEVSGLVDIDTSIASATTVPRTTAAAPTAIAATGGGNEAALTWVAPTNNGGAAITDYRIEFSSDDGVTWSAYSDAISSETSATVDGLSPGTQYRFRVAAINAAGVGTFSAASSAAKTFERAPELTLTLDQQSADGFAFIMKFKDALTGGTDPLQYTLAATTNNPGATVEQVGDFFTVRGLTPGASVTVTVTAQRADYLQAIATIFSSALLAAPAPSLGSAEAIDGGFRLTVNGYGANTAAGFSYAVTSTAGAVIDDGDGVFRIVGLANGESAIATVTASRTGYATVSTSLSGSALALGVAAQIESITGTRDGFTFTIANYTPEATYTLTSSKDGSTVTRTNELVTVTGLTNLEMATITVKTVRTGYMDASIDVVGVALPQSEVNTLASLSLSNGALAFNASTYEYQLAVANTVTTFRVTPTKSDQDSTIAISINGGAAAAISSGTQSSALPLNVGVNTIVVAVTSQVGSVQNYTLYINRAKSPLSTLSALSLSAGTLTGFDSSLSAYEVNVPYNSSSITATATPSNSAATMQIQVNSGGYSAITSGVASSALALNVGNNTVRIEVTSEDGLSTTIYELTITRAGAANSQLGSLAISVGNMPTFSPSILNYEVIVPTGTTTATVTPTLGSGVTGSISVNGVELADGAQSQAITLTAGTTNQITIVVTASDGSSTPYIVNVKVDAPPVALALARSSVGTQSNVAFTVQPQISINDALSNRVLLNTSTVSVAITAGAGGQLIGTTTATAVRGLATFSGLGLRGVAGTTYTLTYSSGALTVATQQVTLTPGEAVALAFRAGSATVASGSALATPLQVAAVDGDGNTVTDYGSAITLAVGTGASLTGTTVQTPASGLATYSDLTLRGTVNPNYTITATSGTLTSATRNVAITFGSATTLAVTRATSGVVSGTAFTTQPQLTIRDSAGNVVTNATAEITISIANGVGGTLTGTTTITAVNGVANFTDLAMSGVAGTAYTVTYSATGLTSASETLTVTAGVPTRLQLATPAAGFNNGTAFNRAQPILRIQDATGNTVTSSTATVSVTISSGGVLLGTTSLAATSGIASFTNLGVFGVPGSVYTLTFASPGLTSATQTILLTSGASLVPTFGTPTPTFDGFTVQITNFSRIFNWTFSILEGGESARISLGSNGLVTVTGMAVGSSATISATTARSGFENGAATVTGSTLLAPLRPTFGATTSTATGFRVQVTNFDSSYAWGISASNGGTATISSTGLINVIDLSPGVSSDVTVTTTKSGRVSASATITGNAIGVESTSANTDISSNLLTAQTLYPLCAGGTYEQEGIANVNDRNSKSKYLCFNASSRLNASYIRNSAGFYTGDIGSKIVTGIQFTSGDSDRSRDPIIYTLFGCASQNSDCTPIVVNGRTGIDVLRNNTGSIQTFLNKSAFNYYKVTFGALRTSWTDSAQVAEVALIGTDALASGRTPLFGAITRTANGFTVPISNFSSLFTWRVSTNVGGAAIGSDGVVTVTGVPSATSATLTVNTSRAKYEEGVAAISGTSLNSALIPTFGPATPTADGFTAPITNYSADYTWSTEVTTGAATIAAGVLTVTGQAGENQPGATVVTNRANYGTGRAQVVASALAVGLTPTFGASISKVDGFTVQITNYSADFTWQVQTTGGAVASLSATGLITVSNLAPGVSALVNVTSSKVGALTVIAQTTGKAQIGAALTPRFALSTSTADGFTVQILNYDANYTWSGTAGAGETVTVSNTGLVTVSGVTTGRMTTATISAARSGYSTGSQTISGTAVAPDVDNVGGQDIQLQVPISATTSPSEVIVTIDIPVDAAPGSTQFTGSAVATDSVDQGLRTVKIGGTTGGTTVTTVSAPIAITIPASAGIGIPVYSPDGANWLELPLLASPNLPEGQEMGYFRYDDGTIVILTRKIGE